ncbi:prepilin peptidase [Photorhabdus australis]|uniref:prepilin peptidase n=1 Tax=Photorhabdus australis TaxID=286156 RepID=UPI0005646AB0|nr:A24 family peptidase [Photorhabdus australis]
MNYWQTTFGYIVLAGILSIQWQLLAAYVARRFLSMYNESPLSSVWPFVKYVIPMFTLFSVMMAWNEISLIHLLFFIICSGFLSLFIFLDSASRCLPQCFTVTFWLIGTVYRSLIHPDTLFFTTFTSLILFGVLWYVRAAYNQWAEQELFGLGDVYLITGLGMWFSMLFLFWIIGIAAVIGTLFLLIKKIRDPLRWQEQAAYRTAPFAPFLCGVAAAWLPWIIGG